MVGNGKKRQRVSFTADSTGASFNDSSTADVVLRLFVDTTLATPDSVDSCSPSDDQYGDVQIYLHSHVLHRSKYFSALLSDRWQPPDQESKLKPVKLNLGVPPSPGSLHLLEYFPFGLLPERLRLFLNLNFVPVSQYIVSSFRMNFILQNQGKETELLISRPGCDFAVEGCSAFRASSLQ